MKETVETRWGRAIILNNDSDYCGKVLIFDNVDDCISMQYHLNKKETWYIAKGLFYFYFIDKTEGTLCRQVLKVGDVVTNERGDMHQLVALEPDSRVFEVSTEHRDDDTYRIYMKTPDDLTLV